MGKEDESGLAKSVVAALDIVSSHPLLQGDGAGPAFRKLVFEKALEQQGRAVTVVEIAWWTKREDELRDAF